MIVDAYAGPRGWSQGLRLLGLDDIGVEWDEAACATAHAAGHLTIRADATTFPLDHLAGRVEGLIMSPPCQAFSMAGDGEGREVIGQLAAAIRDGDWTGPAHDDERIRHVLEAGRWAETLRPTWIACEQVPPVLPLWHTYTDRWRTMGWTAWAGILNAADYGVPQTRRRAFLIARTDSQPVSPPEPTRCKGGAHTMFGDLHPWMSWGEALGWPAGDSLMLDRRQQANGVPRRLVPLDEPAPTVTGIAGSKGQWVFRSEKNGDITARLTIRDALILQGFDADYPVQGSRAAQFRQIGDAVPPPLAARVVAAVSGAQPAEMAA